MRLSTVDLNLLVVFEAVLRERSVTKAGARLGLSQPAMSHALNRLRWLLKDQLFVRTPDGMIPTPRAEGLAQPVRQALLTLEGALEPESFVPARAERGFTIAVNNYAAVVLAAPIAGRCAALAPQIRLALRPSGTLDLWALLDRGELDLAIAAPEPPADRFAAQRLIEDDYVAVLRRGHPAAGLALDLATFAALPHLAITSGEELRFIDAALAARGTARHIGLGVPYLAAGPTLIQSDMVAVLGRQIAREFRRAYAVELLELPIPSPSLRTLMLWPRRLQDQPAHRWLRQTIGTLAQEIASAGIAGSLPAGNPSAAAERQRACN
jgi:DNA-binding transcriptional LysR family regulator